MPSSYPQFLLSLICRALKEGRGVALTVCALAQGLLVLALSCGSGLADEAGAACAAPSVAAATVSSPPTVDGAIEDPCWQEATHLTDFWRNKVDAPPLEPTEAWIGCDEQAIYVAFLCRDSEPDKITATQRKRQGAIWSDDRAMIGLEVTGNGGKWYEFVVTAGGVQWDSAPGGTSEKIEWRGDWRAASRIEDWGWSAEMAIPWSMLRYPNGQRTFRFYFARDLSRAEDRCTWPSSFARVDDTNNAARWTAVPTPPLRTRYTFMPYALSVFSESEDDREPLTAGLDTRATLPSGMVGMFTYNPDFRNLEDVVETIDFTFVERSLPEYRPFFKEGAEGGLWDRYFPYPDIFYSRRVSDLDLGVKAFGDLGKAKLGLLDAYRRGGENHFVWSYTRDLGSRDGFSLSGVERRVPGEPDNSVYAAEFSLSRKIEAGGRWRGAYYTTSQTDGPGGDDAEYGAYGGVWRERGIGWDASYESVGVDFRADDAYVPETGTRRLGGSIHGIYPQDTGPVRSQGWDVSASRGSSQEGSRAELRGEAWRAFRNDRRLSLGLADGERDGYDVPTQWLWFGWNTRDVCLSGGLEAQAGERYGEPYRYAGIRQGFRLFPKLAAQVCLERVYAAGLDDEGQLILPEWSRQAVLACTYDISEERSASARLVRRGDTTNAYAAYRQRVRKGLDLLVVLGDPNAQEWVSRLAVKAIWCY